MRAYGRVSSALSKTHYQGGRAHTMKISRQQAHQLQVQLGCSTNASFRATWRALTPERQAEQLARAQAAA
jgi:hypothetical protein